MFQLVYDGLQSCISNAIASESQNIGCWTIWAWLSPTGSRPRILTEAKWVFLSKLELVGRVVHTYLPGAQLRRLIGKYFFWKKTQRFQNFVTNNLLVNFFTSKILHTNLLDYDPVDVWRSIELHQYYLCFRQSKSGLSRRHGHILRHTKPSVTNCQ